MLYLLAISYWEIIIYYQHRSHTKFNHIHKKTFLSFRGAGNTERVKAKFHKFFIYGKLQKSSKESFIWINQ